MLLPGSGELLKVTSAREREIVKERERGHKNEGAASAVVAAAVVSGRKRFVFITFFKYHSTIGLSRPFYGRLLARSPFLRLAGRS